MWAAYSDNMGRIYTGDNTDNAQPSYWNTESLNHGFNVTITGMSGYISRGVWATSRPYNAYGSGSGNTSYYNDCTACCAD